MCARREKGAAVGREEHRRTDRELSGFPLSPHIIALLEYSLTLTPFGRLELEAGAEVV